MVYLWGMFLFIFLVTVPTQTEKEVPTHDVIQVTIDKEDKEHLEPIDEYGKKISINTDN